MSNKVHVLLATQGEDPVDVTVIGVFKDGQDALAMKHSIVEHAEQFWRDSTDAGYKIVDALEKWYESLPKKVNLTQQFWDYWQRMHNCYRLYVPGRLSAYEFGSQKYRRDCFLKEINECRAKLEGLVEIPALPEFPPLVSWAYDHGLFNEYQMGIHECEVT